MGEPNPNRFYKWTVEIEVNEVWVADGFDLTDERLKEMIESELGYSYSHETRVQVLKAPSPKKIRRAQGYTD
jgi:hypothetical protein